MNERVLQDLIDFMQQDTPEAAESAGILLADFLKELQEDASTDPSPFFLSEMLRHAGEEIS